MHLKLSRLSIFSFLQKKFMFNLSIRLA